MSTRDYPMVWTRNGAIPLEPGQKVQRRNLFTGWVNTSTYEVRNIGPRRAVLANLAPHRRGDLEHVPVDHITPDDYRLIP